MRSVFATVVLLAGLVVLGRILPSGVIATLVVAISTVGLLLIFFTRDSEEEGKAIGFSLVWTLLFYMAILIGYQSRL